MFCLPRKGRFLRRVAADNFLQLLFGGGQQFGSLAGALFGQQGIIAGDQTFAGKVRSE